MVDRSLLRDFAVEDEEIQRILGDDTLMNEIAEGESAMDELYNELASNVDVNQIIEGTIIRVDGEEVLVDIGYKSEGVVFRDEWNEDEDAPEPGQKVQVLLDEIEDHLGFILLSKRKADRIREWEKIIATHAEGDIVRGTVVRKIKGGLLINIGVNVFLPASQVDIRRPSDIADFIGEEIECVILKIDENRRNIVVSRRKLIEDKRERLKSDILAELEDGQIRKGVVKNIADFGAFVDLGGIDGLLHITDMSWGRIDHPSRMVEIDEEIEVMILNIDREKEKIALGLKQKTPSPWENITEKYPVGGKVEGEVVNVMTYGAFVKLEDGIEGLVHISEMSWTKRINHPNELVNIGDKVQVVVLGINEDKQEISLGMKQTQPNPWDDVTAKYPEGGRVKGTVRNLTNYGAFIELEEGVDGLLHVSDMSWTRKISHASEMLKKGDEIECLVLSVDEERRRIALGLKQLDDDPWANEIPTKYNVGTIVTGQVTKITNFGVFVQLEPELEGLLHVSELADEKIEKPEDVVKVGEEIEVRVLRVDEDERKIGLSRKLDADLSEESGESESAGGEGGDRKRPESLKGGTGSSAGPLFSMGASEAETEGETATEAEPEAEATESESDEAKAEPEVEAAEPEAEAEPEVETAEAETSEEEKPAESAE
ncbi:30S ribosomal protein S1 [Polystyrenella longa]|uniref:Small ribosomal subunit protein bS1 n=1 Tax=Polystyrenella longa TaxID=2528007 RepID=A0A518CMA6_9PLAN|nr:30S ribosomal protein S1 [Polystyrenella longa]QDU80357.1 30S ribosomal protein S1 [Polystyrenella longa]